MATITAPSTEPTAIQFERVVEIDASIEIAFQAVLDQLGPHMENQNGDPMPMVLEANPGGRWYRDVDNGEGHLWGFVQAIKSPTLLELYGPQFMSYAVTSNLQYRLAENGSGTTLTMRYSALGLIDPEHKEGIVTGWEHFLKLIVKRALELSKGA